MLQCTIIIHHTALRYIKNSKIKLLHNDVCVYMLSWYRSGFTVVYLWSDPKKDWNENIQVSVFKSFSSSFYCSCMYEHSLYNVVHKLRINYVCRYVWILIKFVFIYIYILCCIPDPRTAYMLLLCYYVNAGCYSSRWYILMFMLNERKSKENYEKKIPNEYPSSVWTMDFYMQLRAFQWNILVLYPVFIWVLFWMKF